MGGLALLDVDYPSSIDTLRIDNIGFCNMGLCILNVYILCVYNTY